MLLLTKNDNKAVDDASNERDAREERTRWCCSSDGHELLFLEKNDKAVDVVSNERDAREERTRWCCSDRLGKSICVRGTANSVTIEAFVFSDLRRRRRDSAPTEAHHQHWNVYDFKPAMELFR